MPGTTDISNFLAAGEPCATQHGGADGLRPGRDRSLRRENVGNQSNHRRSADESDLRAGWGTSTGLTNIPTGVSPLACPAGTTSCSGFSDSDTENYDSGMGRFDYQLRTDDKLSGRYEFDRFVRPPYTPPQELLAYTDGQTIISQNALLHETHTFSAMLLNDFRLSYSRETSVRGPGTDAPNPQSFRFDVAGRRQSGCYSDHDGPERQHGQRLQFWNQPTWTVPAQHRGHQRRY